jgi:SAM-dependent methyltransferase
MQAALSAEDAERLRAFERDGHDRLAQSYHDFFSPVTALAVGPVLAAVRVQPGMRLLDVACGPGAAAGAAHAQGARAVGVDISPRMLELARRLHPAVEFQEADIQFLPFPDGAFDAVICNFGLGHLPHPEAAAADCVRTLATGGRLAFAWWDDPSRQRIQGLFREAIAEIGAPPPPDLPLGHSIARFSDTGELLGLLRGARLEAVSVAEHTATYHVSDTETLWRGGLGSFVLTGAAIRHQTPSVQDQIRAAFERRAAAYRKNDGLHLPIAFKIGSGRKPA